MPKKISAASLSDQVSGKTIRLTWTDGPTKGTTQEHVFHEDGTVEWRSIEEAGKGKPAVKSGEPITVKKLERPQYLATKINDDVCMISYLTQSGYTLTAVLNFSDSSTIAIASNAKSWIPARGTFEVMI